MTELTPAQEFETIDDYVDACVEEWVADMGSAALEFDSSAVWMDMADSVTGPGAQELGWPADVVARWRRSYGLSA